MVTFPQTRDSNHVPSDAAADAFAELALIALARASMFGLVALAFADPTIDLVERLLDGSFSSEAHSYFDDLTRHQHEARFCLEPLLDFQADLREQEPAQFLRQLRIEYARLFIGPGPAVVSPYESLYAPRSDGQPALVMVSSEALAVEADYRNAGVTLSRAHREPPDHFAVEAEFVHFLAAKESDAWAIGDSNLAKAWRRRTLAFLDGHLGAWGERFCRAVSTQSRQAFYVAVARLAEALLQVEGAAPPDTSSR